MGSVEPYSTAAGRRYRVRWRTPDHKSRQKRGFERKVDAERYLRSVEGAIDRGEYVDPTDSRSTIASLGASWLAGREHVMKPSSYRPLESAWRVHVEPHWGGREVGGIRTSEVQAWVGDLARPNPKAASATSILRAYGVLAGILDDAVRDRRLTANPARGITLPRKSPKPKPYLTHAQVEQLALASAYPTLVRFLAYTGLRWGEATGLRLRNVDTLRRRVHVEENAVMVGAVIEVGTPKSHASRSVPFPQFLALEIGRLCEGKARDGLLFGDGHTHMRLPNSRDGWFAAAVKRAQSSDPAMPRVTPHDLRHTAASLAVSSGANVKAVQRMLGHASAAMTLDVYSDLFDDDLDAVAGALDAARSAASVANPWPNAAVVE